MTNGTKRFAISVRLSKRAIRILDILAKEQGITRTAVLELMIRKTAEEAEERIAAIYDLLHSSDEKA